MGILNITTDSFSDGGRYLQLDDALRQVERMVREGADIIDIGGESTRPGSLPVSCTEELDRVIPLIERIRSFSDITLSIDTTKPEVMRAAIHAGATLINDVNALRAPLAIETVLQLNVPVCLMHMQGVPNVMQDNPQYDMGVMSAIDVFFSERIEACTAAGIPRHHLILDPGFGFGKTHTHNLILTQHLSSFKSYGLPLLLGASRKSTIGSLLNRPVGERVFGSVGLAVYAALKGTNIIRTHDVSATKDAMMMVSAVVNVTDEGERIG